MDDPRTASRNVVHTPGFSARDDDGAAVEEESRVRDMWTTITPVSAERQRRSRPIAKRRKQGAGARDRALGTRSGPVRRAGGTRSEWRCESSSAPQKGPIA